MSFREVRNFTEAMRALGYPRLISLENFRTPNFELVADCLFWLVQRYDPGTDIVDDISTEQERVAFLQGIARIMLIKARLKLNIKRLYAADGHAVKELLKVALLLCKATHNANEVGQQEEASAHSDFLSSWSIKSIDAKSIRQLTSEITQCGALLHDALLSEPDLKEARIRAAHTHIETDEVEENVQEVIREVDENMRSQITALNDLKKTSKGLEAKVDKKKNELERSEKRLSTLQSVRPAYMDEYEGLRCELQGLYSQYLEGCRNLQFLQSELDQYHFAEQEKMEASNKKMKKMQNRLRGEELRILRGEQEVDETNIEFIGEESDDLDSSDEELQGVGVEATTNKNIPESRVVDGRKVVGDITGGAEGESDLDDDASIEDVSATESSEVSIMDDNGKDFPSEDDDYEELSDINDDEDNDVENISDDNF